MELAGEWISWKCNSPMAGNMGGVWEWQIRSTRSILSAMLRNHGESINNELLCTLLVEFEGIIIDLKLANPSVMLTVLFH